MPIDLKLDKYPTIPSKINYQARTLRSDTPELCITGPDWWYDYPVQDFDYKFNSWGFRGPEYEQFIGRPVNICLGDSVPVNLGGPIEHSWPSLLAQHFNIPTLNFGMEKAGNDALRLVYDRVCNIFDVQNTFVMYSYLHRRLVDNKFTQELHNDDENFSYFFKHKIPNAYECANPAWTHTEYEQKFFNDMKISMLTAKPHYYNDHISIVDKSRKLYTNKQSYQTISGSNWPSYTQFCKGHEAHSDMYTKKFGRFLNETLFYTNRDGLHLNKSSNKIYADYFYNQWKQRNES